MAKSRHVHHRRDGIILICTRARCAPSRSRQIVRRALLFTAPFALVAGSIALGPRRFGIALALLTVTAYLASGTNALGPRIERGVADVRTRSPRDHATRQGTGSAAERAAVP